MVHIFINTPHALSRIPTIFSMSKYIYSDILKKIKYKYAVERTTVKKKNICLVCGVTEIEVIQISLLLEAGLVPTLGQVNYGSV